METNTLGLEGLFVIEPDRSSDANGRYSHYYSEREFAGGLRWNDPALGIAWPCGDRPGFVFPVDRDWPLLAQLASPF